MRLHKSTIDRCFSFGFICCLFLTINVYVSCTLEEGYIKHHEEQSQQQQKTQKAPPLQYYFNNHDDHLILQNNASPDSYPISQQRDDDHQNGAQPFAVPAARAATSPSPSATSTITAGASTSSTTPISTTSTSSKPSTSSSSPSTSSSSSSSSTQPAPLTPLPCVARALSIDINLSPSAITLSNIPTFLTCQQKCVDANKKSSNSCEYFSYHFKLQQCIYIPSTQRPQFIVDHWSISSPLNCKDSSEICPKVGIWYTSNYPIGTISKDTLWECQKACEQRSDCGFANYDLDERHCNLQPPKSSVRPLEALYSNKFISLSRSCGTSQQCLIAKPKDGSYTYVTPDPFSTSPLIDEMTPSRIPTSTYVNPYTVATFKCQNSNHQLIPSNPYHFCQPDATFIEMVPICTPIGRRVAVLSDTQFIAKGFTKSYLPMMKDLFLITDISDYNGNHLALRDYLQESSAFVIPPPQNERGKRFVDELFQHTDDVDTLREYVTAGGLLLVFHPDRQLLAAVFDWTFGQGVRCEMTDFGATIGTIIPPITSEFEDAFGLALDKAVSPTTRAPLSLLLCNAPSAIRLSPLFSIAEGKGAVAALGLDPNNAAGYGRDNWGQAMIHTIVQLSGEPITVPGMSVSGSNRCKMFEGVVDGASSSSGSVRCCPSNCNSSNIKECCPTDLPNCSISNVPCMADSIKPSESISQCPEQKSFYFNPIYMSSGTSKPLECPSFASTMALVDGTILNASVIACTSTGKLVLTGELPGQAAEERPTGLRDVVCLSGEPTALILGETEPISLRNALGRLSGSEKLKKMINAAVAPHYRSIGTNYQRNLLGHLNSTASHKRSLEAVVNSHIVIVPSSLYGSDFEDDIVTSLRQFAANGGVVVDVSGEFTRRIAHAALSENADDPTRISGNRLLSSQFASSDQVPLEACDPMSYARRPNDWEVQLRKSISTISTHRSSTILDAYVAGLDKVVLESSSLTELKGLPWSASVLQRYGNDDLLGYSRSVDEMPTTPTPHEASTTTIVDDDVIESGDDGQLGDIGSLIPLVMCPSKTSDDQLILSGVIPVGKGFIYSDLMLPQYINNFNLILDLNSLQLPTGYSHIIARLLALSQSFAPEASVPFILPMTIPVPTPIPSSSTPIGTCQDGSCDGDGGSQTNPSPPKSDDRDNDSGSDRMGLVVGAAAAALLASGGLAAGGYFVMKRRNKKKGDRSDSEEFEGDNGVDYNDEYNYDYDNGRAVGLETMQERMCEVGFTSNGELSRRHGGGGGRFDHQQNQGWDSRHIGMTTSNEPMSTSRRMLGFPQSHVGGDGSSGGNVPTDEHGALTGRYVPMHQHIAPPPDPVSTRSTSEAALADEIGRLRTEMAMLQLQIDGYQSTGMTSTARSSNGMAWNGNSGNIHHIPQQRSMARLPQEPPSGASVLSTNRFFPAATTPSTLEAARSPTTAQTVRLSDLDLQPLRSATNASMVLPTNDNSFHPEYLQGPDHGSNGHQRRIEQSNSNEGQGTRFAPRRNKRRSSGFVSRPQTAVRKGLK